MLTIPSDYICKLMHPNFNSGLLEITLFLIYCFAALMQLIYFIFFYARVPFYNRKTTNNHLPPASIIICAKNEDHNIETFLPLVLEQDYPEFEVVVVNDCSFDKTGDVLKKFSNKYPHLRVITIKEDDSYSHGKKFALMIGIKGAKHEHLLFTDADCKPAGKQWLKNMMSNYSLETEIVVGFGGYEKLPGFLNKLIRFDTTVNAIQFLSFAMAQKTYMGVGRNLSYKKSLFFKHKGFASHHHLESGDDDLFVNEAETKQNVCVELSPESFTVSKVKSTFIGWFHQKRRHITTASSYKFRDKFILSLPLLAQWFFLGLLVTLLILQIKMYIVLGIFALRLFTQLFIFNASFKKLGERDLLWLTPVAEIFLMFFHPYTWVSNLFLKRNKWK